MGGGGVETILTEQYDEKVLLINTFTCTLLVQVTYVNRMLNSSLLGKESTYYNKMTSKILETILQEMFA